ncbi:UPF0160 protein MYG1, mitochondrial [Galendromus occidentalis]|uniref:UPF0160 protein MYG1, mitochondrial n=1 Tax=Galendromus occidentalis TaxID=34638 RepID=A0AAJ6VUH3_9ACAR|nr:UPF0160 protein MYG1, mitochondrial [Galendromus occidentalis]
MVPKKIGTHNGTFHCDEALACALLKLLPEYSTAEILRTRDPALLETCDVVVDVGAVYDASKFRFDHHQKTFQETMHSLRADFPWEIKLSSAGLIYFHYGEKILADLMKRPAEHRDTQTVYRKIYEEFIIEIDAIDNGVNMCDGDTRYRINTGLSSRVGGLNPKWNEEQTPAAADRQFQLAMKLAETEFLDKVNYYSNAWLPAKELVREAINKRYEVDKSGRIIELPQTGCPWKDHLFDIEEELGIQGELIYVIHTDTKSYRVQCVPLKLGAFDNRHSLPWRGLRDDELCRESGIPGCIFVHASGFIGGNQTRDGALEMARAALKTYSPDNVSEK